MLMTIFKYIKSLKGVLNHPNNTNSTIRTIVRIIWWKINQSIFKFPAIIEISEGVRCICYPDNSYGGLVVYTKLPEYYDMKFMIKIINKNDIFVDVGAGIGDYSIIAASIIDKGKVYAFEPDQRARKIFIENITLNKMKNKIQVEGQIVSDKEGHEYFKSEKQSEISHISLSDRGTSIKSLTLDKYLKKYNIKRIKLIKIDVEGAELKVLKGLENIITTHAIDSLIVEVNKNSKKYGFSRNDLINFFESHDYEIFYYDKLGRFIKISKDTTLPKKTFNLIAISSKASWISDVNNFELN